MKKSVFLQFAVTYRTLLHMFNESSSMSRLRGAEERKENFNLKFSMYCRVVEPNKRMVVWKANIRDVTKW